MKMATKIEQTAIYVPSDEALKFITFVRAAGLEENSSPEIHYKIADGLFSKNRKDWNLIIECCRGIGKSTTMEYALIYVSAIGFWPNFGEVPFIVFLGASLEGNVKAFFKNVQSKIENSDFLKNLITVARCVDNEIELINKNGVETIITGRGMSTNWRGIRSKRGHRPSVLVADDILPSEVMTSEALRSTIEMNWFSSALPALHPVKHKVIYIGTPLSEADLLHKLKNSGEYRIEKYPLCSKFPCEKEEYDSVWPDRFNYEYTSRMYNQFKSAGKAQSFYTEYMLEVTDLTTLLVDEDDIRWYEPDTLLKHKEHYNFYISTDFATSTSKSADFSVISVWAISSDDSWFLVDGQCRRQGMQDTLDDLFRYAHKWKPLSVGIETSGQQGGFLSILTDMMMSKNIWFQLARKRGSKEPGIRPSGDKTTRFITGVQPKFKQNKIWFPKPELIKHKALFNELLEELVNELSKYTLAGGHKALKHDDAIDTMNQLSEMEIFSPDGSPDDEWVTKVDKNGLMWQSDWKEEDEFKSRRSTIF
ncbi:MAG: hypothetical protein JHC33_00325 [Ignisphaera sp.]|nr:hypothetical protein [Ignisphaera sp.]